MDKKKVYLFELDSVRKTDEEIIYGQQCLYNEIAVNGNVVVMTFNQFIDSRAFFSLLDDDVYRNNIISLFEKGVLRISQFKDTRTLVQYVLDSIDSDKEFIYSALPIKYTQKRLLGLMKRSLIYSDLSELYEYFDSYDKDGEVVHKGKLKKELTELFKEYSKNGKEINKYIPKNKGDAYKKRKEQEKVCARLYHLLETILSLSSNHRIYTYSKKINEYKEYDLNFYLNKVINDNKKIYLNIEKKHKEINFEEAKSIIKSIINRKNTNDRSVYLREIKTEYEKYKKQNIEREERVYKRPYQYAEIIVNLCQNYACEVSIRNISKKYDINDESFSSFYNDFSRRFNIAWNKGEKETNRKYLTSETNEYIAFNPYDKKGKYKKELPDFSKAVRYIDYQKYSFDESEEENNKNAPIKTYEISQQRKENKSEILKGIRNQTLNALFWMAIAYSVDTFGLPLIKDNISVLIPWLPNIINFFEIKNKLLNVLAQFMKSIISTLLTEAISKKFASKFSWIHSFSEALSNLVRLMKDLFTINNKSNNEDNETIYSDKYNEIAEILPIYSPEMKRYINLKKKLSRSKKGYDNYHKEIFIDDNDVYNFYEDYNDPTVKKEINRQEEIFHKQFGMIYKGKYNTLFVDPVKYNNKELIAYDRIISSTGKNGVVIIAKYKNKFIMLKQFRHAFRKSMYNFPRGFSEVNSKSLKNDALRELKEEVGVKGKDCSTPIKLGIVAPDSGLTDRFAHVYYIEVYSFNKATNNYEEGIKEIELLSEKELEELINNNGIFDNEEECLIDGFSLVAYMLYERKIKKKRRKSK